jgi:hypothetical protein
MKKNKLFAWLIFAPIYLFISFYLLLPAPLELPPLPDSLRSIEPGDTVQIPGVSAYYTDLDRQTVISFYENNFKNSSFLGFPLPTFKINHPPEKSRQIYVDTMRSYYLEEIVHPFRESLYVNGFEWENDVFTLPEKRIKNILMVGDQVFKSKVTLMRKSNSPLIVWFVFNLLIIFSYFLAKTYYLTIFRPKSKR